MFISQEGFPSRFDSAPRIQRLAEETMHEIAQPLTILQGCLELALVSDSREDYRSACRVALEQVQRICERFASARAPRCEAGVLVRSRFEAEGLAK